MTNSEKFGEKFGGSNAHKISPNEARKCPQNFAQNSALASARLIKFVCRPILLWDMSVVTSGGLGQWAHCTSTCRVHCASKITAWKAWRLLSIADFRQFHWPSHVLMDFRSTPKEFSQSIGLIQDQSLPVIQSVLVGLVCRKQELIGNWKVGNCICRVP